MFKTKSQCLARKINRDTKNSGFFFYFLNISKVTVLFVIILWFALSLSRLAFANSKLNHDDGGVLFVHGSLSESACRLDMSNEFQDIDLDLIGTNELHNKGDRGKPVKFELHLMDCLRIGLSHRFNSKFTTVLHPIINVSFLAKTNTSEPDLAELEGVSGIGLRILDYRGQSVHLNGVKENMNVDPGQEKLIYTIAPERTVGDLLAGSFNAVIAFKLSYE